MSGRVPASTPVGGLQLYVAAAVVPEAAMVKTPTPDEPDEEAPELLEPLVEPPEPPLDPFAPDPLDPLELPEPEPELPVPWFGEFEAHAASESVAAGTRMRAH